MNNKTCEDAEYYECVWKHCAFKLEHISTVVKRCLLHSLCALQEKSQQVKDSKKPNVLDLFKTPNMRLKTLCMYFNWIVCGLCFYGLAQYMGQIGGNIFINVAVSGQLFTYDGRCSKCKHVQLNNRPSESSSFSLRVEKREGYTGFKIIFLAASQSLPYFVIL
jgi:hypothetical protein